MEMRFAKNTNFHVRIYAVHAIHPNPPPKKTQARCLNKSLGEVGLRAGKEVLSANTAAVTHTAENTSLVVESDGTV
jgi:hypothetical protein